MQGSGPYFRSLTQSVWCLDHVNETNASLKVISNSLGFLLIYYTIIIAILLILFIYFLLCTCLSCSLPLCSTFNSRDLKYTNLLSVTSVNWKMKSLVKTDVDPSKFSRNQAPNLLLALQLPVWFCKPDPQHSTMIRQLRPSFCLTNSLSSTVHLPSPKAMEEEGGRSSPRKGKQQKLFVE